MCAFPSAYMCKNDASRTKSTKERGGLIIGCDAIKICTYTNPDITQDKEKSVNPFVVAEFPDLILITYCNAHHIWTMHVFTAVFDEDNSSM